MIPTGLFHQSLKSPSVEIKYYKNLVRLDISWNKESSIGEDR